MRVQHVREITRIRRRNLRVEQTDSSRVSGGDGRSAADGKEYSSSSGESGEEDEGMDERESRTNSNSKL